MLDDLKLLQRIEIELVHRYLAVFFVPVAEQFPTQSNSYAGAEPAVFVPPDAIPLQADQFAIAIHATEANAGNSISIGSVRISLHYVLVRRENWNAYHT